MLIQNSSTLYNKMTTILFFCGFLCDNFGKYIINMGEMADRRCLVRSLIIYSFGKKNDRQREKSLL